VIIPTVCSNDRANLLLNAISSIKEACSASAKIIVAANGANVDTKLALELKNRADLNYVYFEEGSLPKTISLAVDLIDTEYFCFLDDDDEFLPNGLLCRMAILESNPEIDLVISNGYRCVSGIDSQCLQHLDTVSNDPLKALFDENWLPSCGALFRLSSVSGAYFKNYHAYAEWTWLAFKLALDKKYIYALNDLTFRIHGDTPGSLSKSFSFQKSYIELYRRMLAQKLPYKIRQIIKRRLSQSHHDISNKFLSDKKYMPALIHHLLSLRQPYGWRFFAYSRHIITGALMHK
jgi:glycosyltransferase involved in cell wall biosynthesis